MPPSVQQKPPPTRKDATAGLGGEKGQLVIDDDSNTSDERIGKMRTRQHSEKQFNRDNINNLALSQISEVTSRSSDLWRLPKDPRQSPSDRLPDDSGEEDAAVARTEIVRSGN
ncbi:hypothetical protein Trydic_g21222 [Trypoxylus dichotomus]